MTTMTFDRANAYVHSVRAPRATFAARLATLQARHEVAEHQAVALGVIARSTLALVPFATLVWTFIAR